MSDQTDHDLLVALRSDFKAFYEEFRRISNGVGFPRCAERLARLEAVEDENGLLHKRIDDLKSKLWWAVTFSVSSMVSFIAAIILTLVKGGMANG